MRKTILTDLALFFSWTMITMAGAASFAMAAEPTEEKPSMVYELRTYTTPEGKLPELHKRFRDHTVKLFAKHGMTNVIYWTPTDKPNTLVYLLAHKSEQAGKDSFAAFRTDPDWVKVKSESEAAGSLTTKVESQYLTATDYTPKASVADLAKDKPGLLYELRIYTAAPGKLANLQARFRDHTTKLFEKHGMTNVVYTTPIAEPLKDNTLVYVLAHKDRAAADASWKAFVDDPEWKKVATESQVDGPLLVKDGVVRMYLTPTDYSPVK